MLHSVHSNQRVRDIWYSHSSFLSPCHGDDIPLLEDLEGDREKTEGSHAPAGCRQEGSQQEIQLQVSEKFC